MALTEKSRSILEAIAHGRSYEQILVSELAWTYNDIFEAAGEALRLSQGVPQKSYEQRFEEIRSENPRAYEKWTAEEDKSLRDLFESGKTTAELAAVLQRQPSAIRSRLTRLGLIGPARDIPS